MTKLGLCSSTILSIRMKPASHFFHIRVKNQSLALRTVEENDGKHSLHSPWSSKSTTYPRTSRTSVSRNSSLATEKSVQSDREYGPSLTRAPESLTDTATPQRLSLSRSRHTSPRLEGKKRW
ncbi:hypothetical protein ZHAS_00016823 [Anopheles sinensis]|uniref:Uncharacterized protein n=1 Tax=Anopheles sinensis TaxID=74873 RepID=A0A084WF15_ANOSI|nr:hypothetical protein ZHAS_00016823 [Anopheles sinensis]